MWSWIRARFLLWEWVIPLAIILLVLVVGGPVRDYLPVLTDGMRSTLYGTLASISAGLLGFVIAGVTILLTMGETRRIKMMMEVGMYSKMVGVFNSTAKWLAAGVFVSLAGLALDRDDQTTFHLFSWVVIGISTVWVLRMARCIWVLEGVVNAVLADKKQAKEPAKRTLPFVPIDTNPQRDMD